MPSHGAARSRAEHPIRVVARRTGLSPDVIRVWERRYGAVRPTRGSASRRLYSDADVERLRLLRRATLAGRRIGDLAALSDEALDALVAEDERAARPPPPPPATAASREHLSACLSAVHDLDGAALERGLSRAALDLELVPLVDEVVGPLLREIGEDWSAGAIRIAHEHLASGTVRAFLATLSESRRLPAGAPVIVVATLAGDRHELGAMMAGLAALAEGWRPIQLGADLPAEEIALAAERGGARAVAVSLIHPEGAPEIADDLRRLARVLAPSTVLLVGGRAAASYAGTLDEIGAERLDDLAGLRARLGRLLE